MEIKPKIDPLFPPEVYVYRRQAKWAVIILTASLLLLTGSAILVLKNAYGREEYKVADQVVGQIQTIELVPQIKIVKGTVYAYTSRVEETDSDPFTTASGEKVREGIVANNCLPFGTKIDIDGRVYEVKDRMHRRYSCDTFDIWHSDLDEARRWGKRTLEIMIYE